MINELHNVKLTAAVPALIAILSLINPLPVRAEESAQALLKDWAWTVENKLQKINDSFHEEKEQPQDIHAPVPNIASPIIQKIGDTCSDPGTSDGFYRCVKTFSNGYSVMINNDQEHHGDSFKRQTRIAEYGPKGETQSSKTIRYKIAYKPFSDDKTMNSEFFDIVNRPKNGKITREVIIYDYRSEDGSLKTLTWTSYEQIDETQFAMITRHIDLNFDEYGNPLQGRAEKWKDQKPSERLFYWDRNMSGPLSVDSWKSWQNQILKASPRQIF